MSRGSLRPSEANNHRRTRGKSGGWGPGARRGCPHLLGDLGPEKPQALRASDVLFQLVLVLVSTGHLGVTSNCCCHVIILIFLFFNFNFLKYF